MHRRLLCTALLLAASAHAQTASQPFTKLNAELSARADLLLQPQLERPSVSPSVEASQPEPVAVGALRKTNPVQSGVVPILLEEGIPAQMVAVMMVESGGRADALSPKGARGLWQLMPETARRYGLIVNEDRDERL